MFHDSLTRITRSQMPSADPAVTILALFHLRQPAVQARRDLLGCFLHQRPARSDRDAFVADVLDEQAVWLHVLVPGHHELLRGLLFPLEAQPLFLGCPDRQWQYPLDVHRLNTFADFAVHVIWFHSP